MDVSGYSYFIERRDSDKRWVATVTEFPALEAASKIRNRAINDLQAQVVATITRLHRAGEKFPAPPTVAPNALSDFVKAMRAE
jgi:hypothetical protein